MERSQLTAHVYVARAGEHLIGLVLRGHVYEASGDSIAADHYGIGNIRGQLWDRLAER